MLKSELERIFDESLRGHLITLPQVLDFVLKHERKNACLDNIMAQIKIIEKRRVRLNGNKMRKLIGDVARTFAYAALTEKEQQLMSETQKRALTAKEDRMKDIESTFVKDNEKEALSTGHRVFVPGQRDAQ